MLYTIKNQYISLSVDSLGAQMMHLAASDGIEYLWQGDPVYWEDRAPVLFPFIGRLTNNRYTFHGASYPMGLHGFAKDQVFSVREHREDTLVLSLCENEETYRQYPFAFEFCITYRLQGTTVSITYAVQNRGKETMPFALGGHPGFRVPLVEGERFEDYILEFSEDCQPVRIGFTPQVYLSGIDTPYPLAKARQLPLRHDLFDDDAVILKDMANEVTLRSNVSGRGVRVSYPDMTYLGFWHWPEKDAPYVCIEPWTSLPARQDVVEELSCKGDMLQLPPMESYENHWTITLI